MHEASQYPLGKGLSVLDSRIVSPAVCSIDGTSVLVGLVWAASLLASLPQLMLQRSCPTQQRPVVSFSDGRGLIVLP